MFLHIAANKLSPKQTGRHSKVLLKQKAGTMRREASPTPTQDAGTEEKPFPASPTPLHLNMIGK